jgi:hypothetical protein
MGPILDTVVVSSAVEGLICKESGEGACKRIKHPIMHIAKAHCLTTSVVIP